MVCFKPVNGGITLNTVKIENVDFHNYNLTEFIDLFLERIHHQEKTFIVTANPEIVVFANKEKKYLETLKKADFITPDGSGIVIASKILKQPLKERVAGFDLMAKLLEIAEQNQLKVYLLGAKESTLEKAYQNILRKHPKLQIVGKHHGYFDIEDESIAEEIVRLNPDLVFVALGFPKQEYWIERYFNRFEKGLFMGVGGSFDIWAGEAKRAPEIWIKLNLEWLYRLIKQPTRLKRMIVLPIFLIKVLVRRKQRMGNQT